MDPLSITASVVGLTATCVQTAKALNALKQKFVKAKLTIGAICTEATVISASLSQLQSSMLRDQEGFGNKVNERPELESALDTALTGCLIVFDVLQDEIRKLSLSSDDATDQLRMTSKAKYLWNESTMQDLLRQLRGLEAALTLLLQLLTTETMLEMQRKLQQNTVVLEKVAIQASRLRATTIAANSPRSIFDMSFETQSLHAGDGHSVRHSVMTTTTRFDFDSIVAASPAYRRVNDRDVNSSATTQAQRERGMIVFESVGSSGQTTLKHSSSENDSHLLSDEKRKNASSRVINVNEAFEPEQAIKVIYDSSDSEMDDYSDEVDSDELTNTVVIRDDWASTWRIDTRSLVGFDLKEIERQCILYEMFASERKYLQSLNVIEFVYKRRLEKTEPFVMGVPSTASFAQEVFGLARPVYRLNLKYLYRPMKHRQAANGPWIPGYIDLFEHWLDKAGDIYVEYASSYPRIYAQIDYLLHSRGNAFKSFLESGRNHPSSDRLPWDAHFKAPLVKFQNYCQLLQTLHKHSTQQINDDTTQSYEALIQRLLHYNNKLGQAVEASTKEVPARLLCAELANSGIPVDFSIDAVHLRVTVLYTSNPLRIFGVDLIMVESTRHGEEPTFQLLVLKSVANSNAGTSTQGFPTWSLLSSIQAPWIIRPWGKNGFSVLSQDGKYPRYDFEATARELRDKCITALRSEPPQAESRLTTLFTRHSV